MRALALLLLVAGVAGCVTNPGAVIPDPETMPFRDPIVDDHDHAAFAEHALGTPSMSLAGFTTMSDDGKPFSYIGEMDTWGNLTVVQILGRGSTPGFVVLDVSDPANPKPIGRAEMPYSYVVDVKWSPDGKYVFAAAQSQTQASQTDQQPQDDPGTWLLTRNGFTQFDMSDPTKPVAIAGGLVEGTGCHMLSVKDLGGKLTVFCATARGSVQIFQFAAGGAWTQVGAIGPDPIVGTQTFLDEVLASGSGAPNAAGRGLGPHDITVQEDPLQPGRFVASVPSWDLGLRFYDVTDPLNVVELGAWDGRDATVYEGNVHGAALYDHHGTRLAFVGPELLGETVPSMWILDVTDYAAPKLVGEWHPPGDHPTQGLLLTVHQFQVVNDRLYLAYNHAGVWVLDFHQIMEGAYRDDPARPEVLGYYLPHQEVELYDVEHSAVPNTWDVNVKNGHIFASDRYTGFYVLKYEGDAAGDAAITSST